MRRIINVPKRGIGATTLSRVGEFAVANDMGFYEALLNAEEIPGIGRGASKVLPFTVLIQTLRAKQEYAKVSELLETSPGGDRIPQRADSGGHRRVRGPAGEHRRAHEQGQGLR